VENLAKSRTHWSLNGAN